jgi:thiamine pyrophosphate-dependent acetolactate synthase large subunit-like protein
VGKRGRLARYVHPDANRHAYQNPDIAVPVPQTERELAELLHAPVTTSWAARGVLPETSELAIPMPFIPINNEVRNDADLVLVVGSRLGETDWWGKAPYWRQPSEQQMIQVDIDGHILGGNKPAALTVLAATCERHIERGDAVSALRGESATHTQFHRVAVSVLRASAEAMIATAREDVARMVEQTSIVQAARDVAYRILDVARDLAAVELEVEDAYIDGRLATLEVILNKTMEAVARGRERLEGANDKDVLSQLNTDD